MAPSSCNSSFDTTTTFVRVVQLRSDGFVELEFAIGEPEFFVEMILPREIFNDFCVTRNVTVLETQVSAPEPPKDWEWRLRDAMHKRLGD